jgi:Domain of unknown function (DUF4158)
MRSILRDRPILGEALLQAFARSLGEQDLSPVTARGYLHDLGRAAALEWCCTARGSERGRTGAELDPIGSRQARTQCRGDENRRHFVLQVCVLRRHGRLLEGGETAPVRILNHLGAQLGKRDKIRFVSAGYSGRCRSATSGCRARRSAGGKPSIGMAGQTWLSPSLASWPVPSSTAWR